MLQNRWGIVSEKVSLSWGNDSEKSQTTKRTVQVAGSRKGRLVGCVVHPAQTSIRSAPNYLPTLHARSWPWYWQLDRLVDAPKEDQQDPSCPAHHFSSIRRVPTLTDLADPSVGRRYVASARSGNPSGGAYARPIP